MLTRDDEVSWKSLRNLPQVHVLAADQLNAYDVLCADDVIFTSAALDSWLSGLGIERGDSSATTEVAEQTEEESA